MIGGLASARVIFIRLRDAPAKADARLKMCVQQRPEAVNMALFRVRLDRLARP